MSNKAVESNGYFKKGENQHETMKPNYSACHRFLFFYVLRIWMGRWDGSKNYRKFKEEHWNFIRQVVPLKNFKLESFYSTAAELTSQQKPNDHVLPTEQQPELDKLYKRIELEIKGNDPAVLKSYSWFSKLAANHLGVEIGKSWAIRKAEKERFTVYKSVHIFKRHKVQYEIRTYYQFLHLHRLTSSTADTLLEYLERNLPEGVAMKVTKFEICKKPDYLLQPPDTEAQS